LEILRGLGFAAAESDDPYAAMTELCRRPLVYRAMILSLASLYREELSVIPAIKARFPHVEIWLAHTDGRQAALAEAMRLGADGLLADDGLHRVAGPAPAPSPTAAAVTPAWVEPEHPAAPDAPHPADEASHDELHHEPEGGAGPILTPDELRALLHEQSAVPQDED
jgi:hypothetical protein